MVVSCIVQARVGSERLPGKVLAPLGGQTILGFMLGRLQSLNVDNLIVATSLLPADDLVAEVARISGAEVVRGSEFDVLSRFAMALELFPCDVAIRLTGDCPLIDTSIINAAIALQKETGDDYVSNTLVRTFPDGLDVEVVEPRALIRAADKASDPIEREHVTPYIYRRPEDFRIRILRQDELLGEEKWAVDTQLDLEFVQDVVDRAGSNTFGWRDVVSLVGLTNPPLPGVLRLRPAIPSDSSSLLRWRNDLSSIEYSLTGKEVSPEEHGGWFAERLWNPAGRIWIADVDGRSVGQVRVDIETGVGRVDIAVDPEDRGRGFATAMLVDLKRVLSADYQVCRLFAEVHENNVPSRKAFLRAGFVETSIVGTFGRFAWER